MTGSELIPATVLSRKAIVYVRQSTQSQVMTNLESQRRQYDLVEVARQRGFVDVEIIDDDLGRSAKSSRQHRGIKRPLTIERLRTFDCENPVFGEATPLTRPLCCGPWYPA
jgi:hypothetical protein